MAKSSSVDYSKYTFYAVLVLAIIVIVGLVFQNRQDQFFVLDGTAQGANILNGQNVLSDDPNVSSVVSTYCYMHPDDPRCIEDDTWTPAAYVEGQYAQPDPEFIPVDTKKGKKWKGKITGR